MQVDTLTSNGVSNADEDSIRQVTTEPIVKGPCQFFLEDHPKGRFIRLYGRVRIANPIIVIDHQWVFLACKVLIIKIKRLSLLCSHGLSKFMLHH
jgi:hypothetical protein